MESFLSLLQKNVLDRLVWATREELRIAIVTWGHDSATHKIAFSLRCRPWGSSTVHTADGST
ncbi:hypothetical protein [Kitasatospora sp. NPDC017646]|uniref:hypothetical protein n=1 Tax=Kitasatospora sp. NPDC017646 TaxID=3364024 RepID=UPI0037B71D63